jgi:NADPH-dependent curcumin reductase CurA
VLLVRRPVGIPQPQDFALDTVAVPPPGDGEILVRNIYLSVDPAQRGWAADVSNYSDPVALNGPMRALAVGQVIESNAEGVDSGTYIYGWLGWQDYTVITPSAILTRIEAPTVPLSAYAGPLGINGMTAWLALSTIGRPAPGETVLVSTAAGAVGSIVGQLARRTGCTPIGLTGDDAKAARCVERFGYDRAINYKAGDVGAAIARAAPDGIHVFFDNVGGEILDVVLRQMQTGGRIVQCGTASVASWSPPPTGPRVEREVLTRRLNWGGFVIFDHAARFSETAHALAEMIRNGELTYEEEIEIGIEGAPGALARLYAGENQGKKLIFIG